MKGDDNMELSQTELKEIWSRSDEYYQFTFDEYKSFGSRLKKWRELNNVSQTDMAEAIYEYRWYLGLEDDSVDEVVEGLDASVKDEARIINSVINRRKQEKYEQLKDRRISSIMRTYHQWEAKETESFSADTPFSMNNLYILKQLLQCDYEFLFCEINTPHKHTEALSKLTGLNLSTVEKLSSYDKSYRNEDESSISACYAHGILTALDRLISDDDLMTYISWYLTNSDTDTEDSTITVVKPVAGIPTEDAYMDGVDEVLHADTLNMVYKFTITSKLCQLRDRLHNNTSTATESSTPYVSEVILANDSDSFGDRLKKWREYNKYTQTEVRDLILAYYNEHDMSHASEAAILRTYQNWESKRDSSKDTRLSMADLKMLKEIMNCDYDYLFGDINSVKAPELSLYHNLGLSSENIEKLEAFSTWCREDKRAGVPDYAGHILDAIDLIVTDNDLLSNLAYFLSDMPYYTNMNDSSILKPIKIYGINIPSQDALIKKLYPENKELRNIFLPAVCESFDKLRKRNLFNNQPLIDHENKEFPV